MEHLKLLFNSFNFWGWFLLTVGMQYSAGPANILIATAVGKTGFKKTVSLFIGLWIPAILYSLLIGFGFNTINNEYGLLFDCLTLIGILYIFYLGYQFFQPPSKTDSSTESYTIGLKDGLILSTFNGKLIAAILVMYSVALTDQSTVNTIFLITILFILNGLIANILWGLGGKIFSKLVGPEKIKLQNLVYGLLLIGVAVWMFYLLAKKYLLAT